ncbi:PREDICTED: uncharacterized protein LOC108560222 [Nicrophorus vespilloides]|uniref:Uncharacterized protein LOC108560222 n=1 Tax=Nicrophorus vespilloides TaxID=110193 RepID=A0ABM1MF17_NICVS|nr:PREDICTED: uncharacterized protein LOC108560222 [Nicrophorus vespilloides]
MGTIYIHEDRFEAIVDTRGYAPNEIKCLVNEGYLEITATSGQNQLHNGFPTSVEKTLSRKFKMVRPVVPERSVCCLSNDGMLLIAAPWRYP